jgi:two-component sensor histidine kinase
MLAQNTDSLVSRNPEEFLLLREMHHRFANTFMVLASTLRRDLAIYSPEYQHSLARYEARMTAFGNLHKLLIVGATSELISVQGYVERLCKALAGAFLEPLGVRTEVVCDTGELPAMRCELIGLVIAELVTNAAKHAFHNHDEGLVCVELFRRTNSWICIVSDNGYAPSVALPGIGSKIIRGLVRSFGGNLSRRSGNDGTTVVVGCPIS